AGEVNGPGPIPVFAVKRARLLLDRGHSATFACPLDSPFRSRRLGFGSCPAQWSATPKSLRSRKPPYSRSARTPSPRNRPPAILTDVRVCVGSALHWWPRLQGVFPVGNSEPGSVFGLITGDPDSVTPSPDRVVPVCNSDW